MSAMRWRRIAVAVGLSLLNGCGGSIHGVPWRDTGGDSAPPPVELLQFDARVFEQDFFERTPEGRAQAMDAMVTGFRAADLAPLDLSPLERHAAGVSLLDRFVFLPLRSPVAEIIAEQHGDVQVNGTVSYDSDDPNGPRLHRIQVTGPHTNLLLEVLVLPPDRLITQLQGTDMSIWGKTIRLRRLDDATFDLATGKKQGRLRIEADWADGRLLYALDTTYDGQLTAAQQTLNGQSIWVESDGYWVRTEFALAQTAPGVYLGPIKFVASDCSYFTIELTDDGSYQGQVHDVDGAVLADLHSSDGGTAVLVDPTGDPIQSDKPQDFTLDLAGASAAQRHPAESPPAL